MWTPAAVIRGAEGNSFTARQRQERPESWMNDLQSTVELSHSLLLPVEELEIMAWNWEVGGSAQSEEVKL